MNIDENIFRMPIYPMLNDLNIDELNISFIPQYMDWGIGGYIPPPLDGVPLTKYIPQQH